MIQICVCRVTPKGCIGYCLGSGRAPNRHQDASTACLCCGPSALVRTTDILYSGSSPNSDWLMRRCFYPVRFHILSPRTFRYQPNRYELQGRNGNPTSTTRRQSGLQLRFVTLQAHGGRRGLPHLHWPCCKSLMKASFVD